MANVTPTVAAAFIPELWAQRALDYMRSNIALARLVTKDTDVAAFNVGDVLHIPYPGTFTAADKSPDTAITPAAPSGGGEVTVTLNKHKHVTFLVEDVARAQANQDLMDLYIRGASIALAEQIETDLFALYAGSRSRLARAALISARTLCSRLRKNLTMLRLHVRVAS
jgi:hypothetical protein